jgi:Protein of unknown function (DUF3617)
MREHVVRLCGVALILCQIGAAQAAEQISRKPGLWEVKTTLDNSSAPPRVVQQCIDAATDELSQSIAGPFSAAVCPERNVQRSADALTVDSTCSIAGKPASAHAVVSGSFDSAYTMKVTAEGQLLPGGKMAMTMEGKWLGACTADQRPGDIIMGNGVKINIPDMQKRAPSTIDQTAPH